MRKQNSDFEARFISEEGSPPVAKAMARVKQNAVES